MAKTALPMLTLVNTLIQVRAGYGHSLTPDGSVLLYGCTPSHS